MSEREPRDLRDHTAEILSRYKAGAAGAGGAGGGLTSSAGGANRSDLGVGRPPGRESLVDVLDRVLDKGVVIAGDISISLLDIELLTIKLRLLIASVDKAREMGIDWWNHDPQLSSAAKRQQQKLDADRENRQLRERVEELESRLNGLLGAQPQGAEDDAPKQRAALPPARQDRRDRSDRSDGSKNLPDRSGRREERADRGG